MDQLTMQMDDGQGPVGSGRGLQRFRPGKRCHWASLGLMMLSSWMVDGRRWAKACRCSQGMDAKWNAGPAVDAKPMPIRTTVVVGTSQSRGAVVVFKVVAGTRVPSVVAAVEGPTCFVISRRGRRGRVELFGRRFDRLETLGLKEPRGVVWVQGSVCMSSGHSMTDM